MEAQAQCELIREFMVALAPQVTRFTLESGAGMVENAALVLEASMQLAARYNQLHETLTAPAPDTDKKDQPETSSTAAPVRQAQARIPVKKSDVPDLPGAQEQRRSSPMDPSWRPPSPYL